MLMSEGGWWDYHRVMTSSEDSKGGYNRTAWWPLPTVMFEVREVDNKRVMTRSIAFVFSEEDAKEIAALHPDPYL